VREPSGGLFLILLVMVLVLGRFEMEWWLRRDEVGVFRDGVDGLREWLGRDGVGLFVYGLNDW